MKLGMNKFSEIIKTTSVPIVTVAAGFGFIWQFHADVADLKATARYTGNEVSKNEGELRALKENFDTIRVEFLRLKAETAGIAERTKMLNQNVNRLTKVLVKDLTLSPPLRPKNALDGFRDEVE